jgi:hypothetical protein
MSMDHLPKGAVIREPELHACKVMEALSRFDVKIECRFHFSGGRWRNSRGCSDIDILENRDSDNPSRH